jgi:hypothetical protein
MPEKLILCINYASGMRREFPEHLVKKTGYLSRMGWSVLDEPEPMPIVETQRQKIDKKKVIKEKKAETIIDQSELLSASGLDEFEQLPIEENLNNL